MTELIIDSEKRDKSLFPNAGYFDVSFHDTYSRYIKPRTIRIKSIVFPIDFYNINSLNNKIDLNVTGVGALSVTLPDGGYSSSELASEIATQLSSASGVVFTCTRSQITLHFTIGCTTNTFSLLFATSLHSINKMIGFDNVDTTTANTTTGTLPYQCEPPILMFLKSDKLSRFISSPTILTNSTSTVIFSFPMSSTFRQIYYYENTDMELNKIKLSSEYIDHFDIMLADADNNIISPSRFFLTLLLDASDSEI